MHAHIDKSKRFKFDKKVYKCMFWATSKIQKDIYRVCNLESYCLDITRSATFQEIQPSKYVQVLCQDQSTERLEFGANEIVGEAKLPIETNENDGAMEVDEDYGNQEADPSENDVNIDTLLIRSLCSGRD